MIATYIHDLSPVIIEFTDSIKLRWYGMAYLAAFVVGCLLLKYLGNRKLWVLPGSSAADFIFSTAFFGVFLGGRMGYILFYHIPENGWGWLTEDPMMPLRVWEGGMASHGGILGVMIFTFYYKWKKNLSWTGLGDGLCVVAPLGLMFGRMANFINGELYGRAADFAWAVKFPAALWNPDLKDAEFGRRGEAFQEFMQYDSSLAKIAGEGDYARYLVNDEKFMLERFREDDGLRELAGEFLEPRHPSQLYEAFFEGALLFAILWFIRVRYPKLRHGILTGLFFVLYAAGRIFCEAFREREEQTLEYLSRGQFLSLFMILIGMAFIIWGMKKGGNAYEDRSESDNRDKS